MKTHAPRTIWLLALLMLLITGAALANDQIVSTVTPLTNPYSNPPIIQINGVQQGNIRLLYTVIGTSFPCGPQNPFATFNLNLVDQQGTGTPPSYPVSLSLADSGNGTPIQLAPSPGNFSVTGVGWNDNSTVSVNIDCSKLGPPTDGQVIDGQMNESTPSHSHLDTITSVQVHIMLVFPASGPCLKLYSLESDQDTFDVLTSVTVVAPRTTVKSTNPGSVSADALVVNTCQVPETYDVMENLDPRWQTSPGGTAFGNSTFTYTTAGEVDPTNYGLATWGVGSPQGQRLCINNFTLQPGDSFLMRVHSQIMNVSVTNLPGYPSGGNFSFSSSLITPNTACSGTLLPTTLVSPANPGTSSLAWTF